MNSLSPAFSSSTLLMNDALIFVPKLVMALVILVVGFFIAKALKKVSMRAMTRLLSAKVLDDTPVDEFLEGADMKKRLDQIIGSGVFWLVLLITLYLMAGVLGFTSLTYFLAQLFSYVPNIISASVVLIIAHVTHKRKQMLAESKPDKPDSVCKVLIYLMPAALSPRK